jgi:hypothetical protein
MAAGLGFKDFVTGEVLTAADVDGYLMQGIWVFANATARDAAVTSPQEGNACYLKDTNQVLTYSGSAWVAVGGGSPLTTKGDLYGFSTVDARIPIGTNNQVLTADSTQALGLKWATPAGGGGKVLQVVTGTTSTIANVASSTFADTNLTATITPTAATSKILVLTQQLFRVDQTGSDDRQGRVRLRRDSTTIWDTGLNEMGIYVEANTGAQTLQSVQLFNYSFMDSPSTTSAITYKTQAATGGANISANYQSTVSSIHLLEIGA